MRPLTETRSSAPTTGYQGRVADTTTPAGVSSRSTAGRLGPCGAPTDTTVAVHGPSPSGTGAAAALASVIARRATTHAPNAIGSQRTRRPRACSPRALPPLAPRHPDL